MVTLCKYPYLRVSWGTCDVVAPVAAPSVVAEHVGIVATRIRILQALVDVLKDILLYDEQSSFNILTHFRND